MFRNVNHKEVVRIGVFPSGSEVSAEVYRSLRFIRNFELVGLSSAVGSGAGMFAENLNSLPFISDQKFILKLKNVVKNERLDFIIPGMDEVGYLLKLHEDTLGCEIVYASQSTASVLRRKSTTYKALHSHIPVPKVYESNCVSNKDFPLFLKPDIGYGSRGASVVNSLSELKLKTVDSENEYILSEFLPGTELTVDCFSSPDFNIMFAGPRVRTSVKMGISVSTKTIKLTEEIYEMASSISRILKLSGCWFFQIKATSAGNFKLLEVAARVSGSMALYRKLGINFILLDLYQRMGASVKIPRILPGNFRLERSLEARLIGKIHIDSVYTDLDDCLIIGSSVNTELISFLYACRNKGFPINLVTRHIGNLEDTLKRYRLSELFDQIYHLKNEESKHTVIVHQRPLFIDDSYRERCSLGVIPLATALSPDMVDINMIL